MRSIWLLAASLPLIAAHCAKPSPEMVAAADVDRKTFSISKVREIQPEEARRAIIELLERSSDGALKLSLPLVKKATIAPSVVGGKWLDIGPWAFFAAERTVSTMVGTPASYHRFQGDLELSSDGTWRVTNLRGGYVCALPLPPAPPPMVPPAR